MSKTQLKCRRENFCRRNETSRLGLYISRQTWVGSRQTGTIPFRRSHAGFHLDDDADQHPWTPDTGHCPVSNHCAVLDEHGDSQGTGGWRGVWEYRGGRERWVHQVWSSAQSGDTTPSAWHGSRWCWQLQGALSLSISLPPFLHLSPSPSLSPPPPPPPSLTLHTVLADCHRVIGGKYTNVYYSFLPHSFPFFSPILCFSFATFFSPLQIFVEFAATDQCQRAQTALAGRKFANRVVVTSFFDPLKYQRKDFVS